MDGLHELLVIHVEGDLPISFEVFEEILVEIPSVPRNDGAAFDPLLCAKVQLVALLILQEESARDFGRAVRRALDKDLSCSGLDSAQENEL